MENIVVWRLVVDFCLAGGLVFIGLRMLRPGANTFFQSSRMAELESSLRELIKQAEKAGSAFNDELLSRKRSLEKLLQDLDDAELQSKRSMEQAEDLHREIRSALKAIKGGVSHSAPSVASESAPDKAPVPLAQRIEVRSEERSENKIPPQFEKEPQAPSFAAVASRGASDPQGKSHSITPKREAKPSSPVAERSTGSVSRSNLSLESEATEGGIKRPQFERLTQADVRSANAHEAPAASASRLADQIEKEVSPTEKMGASIERIYNSAESLLRAGENVAAVSAKTELPEEEVRAIERLMKAKAAEERKASPITRERHTL